ncbi:MAG: N-glycosidase YbiA [Solirubrobacterales bacterium]|jgi:ribA/ribD-fused uncharacterized protein|nr:N-glycosidase YbiA [Solirubrobacterales bacterium]
MSAVVAYRQSGPWDSQGTVYFYGGKLSNFALTSGLQLPGGWQGHPQPAQRFAVPTVEHYFQACKAQTREEFLWVLSAPGPVRARRRGGPRGEGGRRIALRADWEEIKFSVMRFACARKFALPGFRDALLGTGDRPLVEDSPSDFVWGGRDLHGGYTGRNLLGLALMEVRADLRGA